MNTTWKTVRVFISSTFRDMQAERDHLVRFVFPRLREQLLPRRIHLVDVDLRWGVTSEQDASEVCREIIDECRPRFLCILGGRYGWVPPGKIRSITADEVHYGVLDRAPEDRGFAYFYFRDAAATAAMVETTPGELREPQGSDNKNKLGELKQAISSVGLDPFTYPAQWDNDSRRLTGLREFGNRVCDDLLASMKSDPELGDRFETDTTAQPDEFAMESAAMEVFVAERSERFVLGSREAVLNELLSHASGTGGNGYICLTGEPGSGKSALLAHLSQHPNLSSRSSALLIRHFVGASPGSTDVRRTLRQFCHELKAGCPDITADIPDDLEILRVVFPDLLKQVCARQRVVILLDGVNQFDAALHSSGLRWLPQALPTNARVILSALDGPVLEELRLRCKPHEIELERLTTADGEAIIEQFRKRYRKKFEPEQRAALLAKTGAGTPLYLLAALEELRTLGTHKEITSRIAELPPTPHELFAWILERLAKDDGFRDAAGRRVGDELVPRFAALLGASRYGLSQRELADLLDAGDPQGNVAAMLHLLRPYLMRRGELLDFYHGQFRAAAEDAWLKTDVQRRAAHAHVAGYFRAKADPEGDSTWAGEHIRHFIELPHHLAEGEAWTDLTLLLSDWRYFETSVRQGAGYDVSQTYAAGARAILQDGGCAFLPQTAALALVERYAAAIDLSDWSSVLARAWHLEETLRYLEDAVERSSDYASCTLALSAAATALALVLSEEAGRLLALARKRARSFHSSQSVDEQGIAYATMAIAAAALGQADAVQFAEESVACLRRIEHTYSRWREASRVAAFLCTAGSPLSGVGERAMKLLSEPVSNWEIQRNFSIALMRYGRDGAPIFVRGIQGKAEEDARDRLRAFQARIASLPLEARWVGLSIQMAREISQEHLVAPIVELLTGVCMALGPEGQTLLHWIAIASTQREPGLDGVTRRGLERKHDDSLAEALQAPAEAKLAEWGYGSSSLQSPDNRVMLMTAELVALAAVDREAAELLAQEARFDFSHIPESNLAIMRPLPQSLDGFMVAAERLFRELERDYRPTAVRIDSGASLLRAMIGFARALTTGKLPEALDIGRRLLFSRNEVLAILARALSRQSEPERNRLYLQAIGYVAQSGRWEAEGLIGMLCLADELSGTQAFSGCFGAYVPLLNEFRTRTPVE